MPALPRQFLIQYKDGTIRTVMAHSVRGAAKIFVMERQVEQGDKFSVKERLGGAEWTHYTRTKNGIREIPADDGKEWWER